MMKIGIITIQKSQLNYGACLQCYALFKRIKNDYGHCEVIDILRPMLPGYKPSPNYAGEIGWRLRMGIMKQRLIHSIRRSKAEKTRENRFAQFSNRIDYSPCYHSVNNLYKNPPKYDIYITGSDQVWNPNLPYIYEPYFLTFTADNDRRISYASSFGIEYIPEGLKPQYSRWLKRYQRLSTREDSGAHIIKSLTGVDASVVMDPVFLLNREEWRKVEEQENGIEPGSYVYLYMLHYNAKVMEKAVKIAKARNKKLYYSLSQLGVFPSNYGEQLDSIGPSQWLWLIDNADTVVTTSFHGSAFTVLFGKPLAIFTKKGVGTNTRIDNLAHRLELSDHIHDIDTEEDYSKMDFSLNTSVTPQLMDQEVAFSLNYLNSAINERKN